MDVRSTNGFCSFDVFTLANHQRRAVKKAVEAWNIDNGDSDRSTKEIGTKNSYIANGRKDNWKCEKHVHKPHHDGIKSNLAKGLQKYFKSNKDKSKGKQLVADKHVRHDGLPWVTRGLISAG